MGTETAEKPTYFYKYVTAEVATAILMKGRVRFSSAERFNDPFDLQFDSNIGFPFSKKEFLNAMSDELECIQKIIRSNPSKKEIKNISKDLVKRMQSHPDLTKLEILEEYEQTYGEWYENEIMGKIPIHHEWISKAFVDSCFFCVSKTSNNILMWSHYAKSHKGAVIKLKRLAGRVGSSLLKIEYEKNMPQYASLNDFVKTLPYDEKFSPDAFFNKFVKTKSIEWRYEREYRASGKFENEKAKKVGYEDKLVSPEEIVEIVFGCRMLDKDQERLSLIIKEKYPHVQISKAIKSPTKFALDYVAYENEIRETSAAHLYSKKYADINWSSS